MFKRIIITLSLLYADEEEKDRIVNILDDNTFIKKVVIDHLGEIAGEDVALDMDSVEVSGKNSRSVVVINISIEGELVHKPDWYKHKQDEIFRELKNWFKNWFDEIDYLELTVSITLHPTPAQTEILENS